MFLDEALDVDVCQQNWEGFMLKWLCLGCVLLMCGSLHAKTPDILFLKAPKQYFQSDEYRALARSLRFRGFSLRKLHQVTSSRKLQMSLKRKGKVSIQWTRFRRSYNIPPRYKEPRSRARSLVLFLDLFIEEAEKRRVFHAVKRKKRIMLAQAPKKTVLIAIPQPEKPRKIKVIPKKKPSPQKKVKKPIPKKKPLSQKEIAERVIKGKKLLAKLNALKTKGVPGKKSASAVDSSIAATQQVPPKPRPVAKKKPEPPPVKKSKRVRVSMNKVTRSIVTGTPLTKNVPPKKEPFATRWVLLGFAGGDYAGVKGSTLGANTGLLASNKLESGSGILGGLALTLSAEWGDYSIHGDLGLRGIAFLGGRLLFSVRPSVWFGWTPRLGGRLLQKPLGIKVLAGITVDNFFLDKDGYGGSSFGVSGGVMLTWYVFDKWALTTRGLVTLYPYGEFSGFFDLKDVNNTVNSKVLYDLDFVAFRLEAGLRYQF